MAVPKYGRPLRDAVCPECGGRLFPGRKALRMHDVLFGTFPVHECERCGEHFFTARGWSAAEKAARSKGLFGIANEADSHHPMVGNAKTGA